MKYKKKKKVSSTGLDGAKETNKNKKKGKKNTQKN